MQDLASETQLHTPRQNSIAPSAANQLDLQALSAFDRDRFFRFGWGPSVTPRFATILEGFSYYAALQPDVTAAEHQGASITYGALDQASDRLANLLAQQGVKRGQVVGLYLQRSIEMVVGILAVMKVGAAYAPQHVGVAPIEGLKYIAKQTEAKVLLTLSRLADDVPVDRDHQVLIAIDEVMSDTSRPAIAPQGKDYLLQPDDRAMVLFTSGTTGVPNGVQVTHRNLCNILQTRPGNLGMRPGLRVGQILSIAFDMAAWETLGALSNGATLVIRGKSIAETAAKVDILIGTPSILNTLDVEGCQHIKAAAVAGEPCPRPLADAWSQFCTFYNSCGPTETTIINTAEPHSAHKAELSIGRPTPNNTVYVLDEDLSPLPIGEKGTMWAGGDCVTAGYLANPNLTDERYRPDPFRPGHIMFNTRDLGSWTDDGELLHHGRVDDLVKICGFRVELDGVSSALEMSEGCEQAVTLKYDDRNLVSFIAPATADPELATQSVVDRLPYYNKPALVMALDELPRTARGKIDKRLLLDMAKAEVETRGVELK
ncbi:amino acid adenylation domain-containing protein [Aliiroseovarius halocynthiae]|uniref:AMP-binding protein n=1 Tax=Aliiroseovarius halocynthiae TaxID=985055 RepID=A0A545SQ93_9RHOB|nr:AMP-binding protein [Aliiroseovarius halocynthiae]TQV67138.1 AMP-binding protein [Aliiroseovarius halocynthiae]SMR82133.1 amino acid adenylation domain-containing protein [Aliiroseovarius halocynthiae]